MMWWEMRRMSKKRLNDGVEYGRWHETIVEYEVIVEAMAGIMRETSEGGGLVLMVE